MDRRTSGGTVKTDSLRGLKALVIGMGIAVVLGTALVIGVAVKRFYDAGTAPVEASAPESAAPPSIRLPAPPGSAISGIAAVDGRLAVWVKDGKGGEVMLIDPRTNQLAGTVTLAPR